MIDKNNKSPKKDVVVYHETKKKNSFRFYKNKMKKKKSDTEFFNSIFNLQKKNELIKIIPIDPIKTDVKNIIPPQFKLLDLLLSSKKMTDLDDFESESDTDSDSEKYDIKKKYEEIVSTINSIQDLINLAKKYKESKKNLAFNSNKLYKLIPHMEELNSIIGMHNVKKQIINVPPSFCILRLI